MVQGMQANSGLGIRKITTFNKALLGKRLWRFGFEDTCDSFKVWGGKGGLDFKVG